MAERKSGNGGCLTIVALCLAVAWCSNREPTANRVAAAPAIMANDSPAASLEDDSTTADNTIGDDGEVKGGETYSDYDTRRDQITTGLYLGGDECTEDCGGHDAGREWAERQGITSPDDCGGKSWSFEEGCRSYAREQEAADEQETDEDEGE